jgi:hypothetical protein
MEAVSIVFYYKNNNESSQSVANKYAKNKKNNLKNGLNIKQKWQK